MALPHDSSGTCEIGCNLQAQSQRSSPSQEAVLSIVSGSLPSRASIRHSYVIGLTPAQALGSAEAQFAENAACR
jgi:hypothetical protein